MARIVADIETDGLLDTLTKIHCICTMDLDTGEERSFNPSEIDAGIAYLETASELIFHNGIGFDLVALRKIYPNFSTDGITLTDTLVLSRLCRPDLKNDDFTQVSTTGQLSPRLRGSHSLRAWGFRLGVLKGDFGDGQTDWSVWTPEMTSYCMQDVRVTAKLWEALAPQDWSQESIRLEHSLAEICHRIGNNGWTFDKPKAIELYASLAQERADLESELRELFPAWEIKEEFVPKRDNKTRGYKAGVPVFKTKLVEFNPNSRRHIEHCLREKYRWKPKVFTAGGDAKIDETILKALPYPEAQRLAHGFLLTKRVGALAEGKNAWLKLEDNGVLRHTIISQGTVTGRAAHRGPNLAQVPATRAPYGEQCRELFTVPPGYSLVGCDLSGLELRCLAHYLNDGGAYAKELLEGDIHEANRIAAGLPDRSTSKVFGYAWLYGAGDLKLGSIIGKGAAEGKRLREQFLAANPALAALVRAVKAAANSRGYLVGLDGRRLPVRSEHGALNLLLQSAGAIICKYWVELADRELRKSGVPAYLVGWIHDELQCAVQEGHEIDVGNRLQKCAAEAARAVQFKLPIDAEFSVGRTWAATH